ncbi:MAG TPA: hypothetical protein VHW09_26890 [Bryobacteraceae bacterium]|jgi:hypothetical protein|nr:hypothetical protein [Bryobacteraceae bacterium]
MTILQAISLLNGTVPNGLVAVQRVMLMNGIVDAARNGDKDARQFIDLCALNVATATRH